MKKLAWAPRVSQGLIQRLYELDAQGIQDQELIDEVGWALFSRCDSFIAAVEATQGKARCPSCQGLIIHNSQPDQILHCLACGWETTWQDYFKTIQHQQLSGAEPVLALFRDYIQRFPLSRQPHEKMVLIDQLIHGFHWNTRDRSPTRTTGVNLIAGNYHEVVDFLDRLSYGPGSTPGVHQVRQEWREIIQQTATKWRDSRLARKE
jgi:hypothetical protein